MLRKTIYLFISILSVTILLGTNGCINDPKNEEATGIFSVLISGNVQKTIEGVATFNLISKDQYSWVVVRLEEDELNYVRLAFINSSSTSIFLEPGNYNIVSQINPNNQKESLVDYYIDGIKNVAYSGIVSLGVSKEIQLKGSINGANFTDLSSVMSGNYDAKRE